MGQNPKRILSPEQTRALMTVTRREKKLAQLQALNAPKSIIMSATKLLVEARDEVKRLNCERLLPGARLLQDRDDILQARLDEWTLGQLRRAIGDANSALAGKQSPVASPFKDQSDNRAWTLLLQALPKKNPHKILGPMYILVTSAYSDMIERGHKRN